MSTLTLDHLFDAIIVGGGAAGVGDAVALRHAGIENFLVLERHTVGASFASWPAETRFITPSFPTNSAGMLDLNSVAIGTSPACTLKVEHPTGKEYASLCWRLTRMRHAASAVPGRSVEGAVSARRLSRALGVEWLGPTAASVCWIGSMFVYGISSGGDRLQLCAASAWLLANIAALATAEDD